MKKTLLTKLIYITAFIICIFEITVLIFYPTTPSIIRGVHILLVNMIVLLGVLQKEKNIFHRAISFVFLFLNIATFTYAIMYLDDIVYRGGFSATTLDLFFAASALIVVLYTTWCMVGYSLPIIVIIFVLYTFFGKYIPGFFGHRGYSLQRILVNIYSFDGLHGIPLGVASTTLAMFIIFGQIFNKSGIGDFFMQIAYNMTKKSRGGAAKTAVVSSAFFGTISGSAVVNVSATGCITIPMMKKLGYNPVFAGAVEAVASTGGQLMPPIMASAAFVMAEIMGVPYITIAKSAIIPALLYFLSVWLIIDLRSDKIGLKAIGEVKESTISILKSKYYLLIPLIVLIYVLFFLKYTPVRSAFVSLVTTIIMMLLISPKDIKSLINNAITIGEALIEAGMSMSKVSPASASAGVIAGLIGLTGLGTKISGLVSKVAGANILLALIASMCVALIFGMGMPTTISYILCASIIAPALIGLGIIPLAAHFFILYFAILSNITPPVAMAAYAAAGISGANPLETAKRAVLIALPVFILPYIFVYDTSMLLINATMFGILRSIITSVIAVLSISVAVEGWVLNSRVTPVCRILFFFSGFLLLVPTLVADAIGILFFCVLLLIAALKQKSRKEKNLI